MSDEESFVILGSTPTPSMEAYSSLPSQPSASLSNQERIPDKDTAENMVQSSLKTNFSLLNPESIIQSDGAQTSSEKLPSLNPDEMPSVAQSLATATETHFSAPDRYIDAANHSIEKSLNASFTNLKLDIDTNAETSGMSRSSIAGMTSLPESVAEKYILGKIDENTIKQTIYSQFPSFCNPECNQKDVDKLQQLINDNNIFKTQLWNVNSAMKQLIEMIKLNKNAQMKHQNEIAVLRNENLELKQELEARMDAIKLSEQLLNKDNLYLRQSISEKSSIINNMSAQIDKLESQQQDMSYDFIKETMDNIDSRPKPELILAMENSRQLKEIERKLSEVTAENLELQDMKQTYIDELNCLKVNLTAAEELLKKAQVDISFLKSKDEEKSEILAKYDEEKVAMKEEIELLKAQLEVYRNDFQMERNARQELAGEKDKILTDLKMLQRRNQQLIEENQQRLQSAVPTSSSSSRTASSKPTSNEYLCPICNKAFPSLAPLEQHVQTCY